MKNSLAITTLFVDVGGILLTNGRDHHARRRAAARFHLSWTEMENRHRLAFETREEGKLTVEEYLGWMVFYVKRSFTRAQFQRFWFEQSKPYPNLADLASGLKVKYGLKVVVVSNESCTVNACRICKFKLDRLVDTFVSFCFVQMRKPESAMLRLALDLSQATPAQVLFIDSTPMFVEVAQRLGMQGILHTGYASTRAEPVDSRLLLDGEVLHGIE